MGSVDFKMLPFFTLASKVGSDEFIAVSRFIVREKNLQENKFVCKQKHRNRNYEPEQQLLLSNASIVTPVKWSVRSREFFV